MKKNKKQKKKRTTTMLKFIITYSVLGIGTIAQNEKNRITHTKLNVKERQRIFVRVCVWICL